jgi:pimeloyl-ACP methyl ester carboxylesterase
MPFQNKKHLFPPFYTSEDAVKALQNLEDFKAHTYKGENNQPLHFVQSGNHQASEKLPAILFIHGSPGNWEGWAEYLQDQKLREKYFMVAVDRPGYGRSDNDISGTSLKNQAKIIMSAMHEHYPSQKQWIIVGHSYGGPVALRLNIDYPDSVASVVLLAPAISPTLVRVRFYNHLAKLPLIRSLLPLPLHRSNDEMFLLPQELSVMKSQLREITKNITLIQGAKDGIVHPDNAIYAQDEMMNADIKTQILPKRGHFLPWEEYDLIKNMLLKISA